MKTTISERDIIVANLKSEIFIQRAKANAFFSEHNIVYADYIKRASVHRVIAKNLEDTVRLLENPPHGEDTQS